MSGVWEVMLMSVVMEGAYSSAVEVQVVFVAWSSKCFCCQHQSLEFISLITGTYKLEKFKMSA